MNEEKLLAVYESMEPRLHLLACRILGQTSPDVEDALQNALLKAWLKYSAMRNELSLANWLYQIVRNESITLLRQRIRRGEWLTDDFSEFRGDIPLDQQVIEQLHFICSLNALRPSFRETIILYYFQGLKIREIAVILQRPESTVKSILYRARRMMRKAC